MSTMSINFVSTPNLVIPWQSKENVQPYSVSLARISSPATTLVHNAAEMAPMPEAAASAASPFSNEASFSSACVKDGLERRE